MPDDWFTPTLDFVSALAWPLVVIALLLIFRSNVAALIDDLSEVTGFGASAKRRGNHRSETLKKDTGSDLEEGASGGDATAEEPDTNESLPLEADETRHGAEEVSAFGDPVRSPSSTLDFIKFYRNLAQLKMASNAANTFTTSAKLSAEIVRNTYGDLRMSIRVVAFHIGGPLSVSGQRGRKVFPHVTLGRIDAPENLIDLVREARDFADDVAAERVKLDGQGADTYVDTCLEISRQLFEWASAEVAAGSPDSVDS